MNKKPVLRSIVIALVLAMANYGIGMVARTYMLQPTGRMTGDIQRQNAMVSDYAGWVCTLLASVVIIVLYLKENRPGYRQLFIRIATIEGVLTIIGSVRGLVALQNMPETNVPLAANLSWVALTAPLGFIKETVLVGLLTATVIAVINRIKPPVGITPKIPAVVAVGIEQAEPALPPEVESQAAVLHPLVFGVLAGGGVGFVYALVSVLILRLSGSYAMLLMFYFPSITGMETEFSGPFVPEYLHSMEKYYGDIMAVLIHTTLGIMIATIVAWLEARSGRKTGNGLLLRIAAYVGLSMGALRGLSGHFLAAKHFHALLSSPIVWTIGALIIGLLLMLARRYGRPFSFCPLTVPLDGSRQLLVAGGMLLVATALLGQGLDIAARRSLELFSTKFEQERQQRDSAAGLVIDRCDAHWESNGDLIVSGTVTNSTGLNKPWFIDAKTLDINDRVLTTAKVLDGRQLFSIKEQNLLMSERGLPDWVVRAPERQLAAKSSQRFEFRLIQPPPEAVSYSLALKHPPYNELAASDLNDMKGALEQQYAEFEKNGGTSPEVKQPKKSAGRKEIDRLGLNVTLRANYTTDLEATAKSEIFRLRQLEIARYRDLDIFPTYYTPNSSIFGRIDDKIGWLQDTPLFLLNPYLLVVEAGGEYVNGIFAYCPMSSLTYSSKRICISYDNESARKWRHYINDYYQDSKGVMRLWFVNAMDAGFAHVHVDPSRSVNVEPVPGAPPDHVMSGVYTPAEFFHVGRKGKNNISPNDIKAKLKLKDPNARTTVYVKLWRKKPATPTATEDFAYVIDVAPTVASNR